MLQKDYAFISYSSKDEAFVANLTEILKSCQISYWKAPEMLPAGTNYAREIPKAIQECNTRTGYIIDPHGAVAWKAWDDIRHDAMSDLIFGTKNDPEKPGLTPNVPFWGKKVASKQAVGIVLETAHPAKFGEIVQDVIGREPSMPDRLEKVLSLPDNAISMTNKYEDFKEWLVNNL